MRGWIRVRSLGALLLVVIVTIRLLAADQERSASVSGIVIDESGRRVPRATVIVRLPGAEAEPVGRVTADDRGGFTIGGLPAGEVAVLATKPGYVDARSYVRQAVPNVTLSRAGRATVTLRLQTGGVISGTVVDRDGAPAHGVLVAVEGRLNQFGRIVPLSSSLGTRTNSRGEYRLFGLAAGSYVVNAIHPLAFKGPLVTADGAGAESYVSLYHPDSLSAKSAVPITIAAGEERSGVDFRLKTIAVSRVEVDLTTAQGSPIAGGRGFCHPSSGSGHTTPLAVDEVTVTGDAAVLTCPAVMAGPHTILLKATPRQGGETGQEPAAVWGTAEVVAAGKPLALSMTLYPGERVTGRATIDGLADTRPDFSAIFIELELIDGPFGPLVGDVLAGTMAPDTGEFAFESVPPGQYRIALEGGAGWTLSGAVLDGRDVLDLPFDVGPAWASDLRVSLSRTIARLSGRVQGPDGAGRGGQTVIAIAADDRYWLPGSRRVQSIRSDLTGRFEFRGLPPGQYWLATDAREVLDEAWDSAVLLQLSRSARRIVLGPGQALIQDLTVR